MKESNNNGGLPVDKINILAGILKEQGLTEIEIEVNDTKIRVRKEATVVSTAVAAAPAPVSVAASPAVKDESLLEIKSPMVGTYYSASSPDAEPFVKVGDRIKKGDTVCIIEAMKLMNELPADQEGEVVAVMVNNGEAISFGQVILKLRKVK